MSTTWRKCRRTTTEQASPRGARKSRIRELFGPGSPTTSSSSDSESKSPSPPRRRRRHGFRRMVKKMVGRPRSSSIAPESPTKEYVGVRYRVELNKYVTEIRPTKSAKKIWLGTYDTAEEAARAFDIGNLCCKKNLPLNFPDSPRMLRKVSSRLSPDEARNAIAKLAKEVARVVVINVAPNKAVDRAAAQKAHDLVQQKSQQSVGSPEPRTQHFEVDGSAAVTYTEETPQTHHVVAVMEELDLVATSMPLSTGGEGGSGEQAWSFDVTQAFVDDERAHIRAAAQQAHDLVQHKSQQLVGSPEPRTQHFEVDGSAAVTYTEETPQTHHVVAVMEELDSVATSMPLSAGGEGGSGGQAWSFDVTQVFVDDERASFPLHKLINFGPDQPGEVLYHYHA